MSKKNNRKTPYSQFHKSTHQSTPPNVQQTPLEDKIENTKIELAIMHEEKLSSEDIIELKNMPQSEILQEMKNNNDLSGAWIQLEELWKKAEKLIKDNEQVNREIVALSRDLEHKHAEYKFLQEKRAELARKEEGLIQKQAEFDAGFSESIQTQKDQLLQAQKSLEVERNKLLEERHEIEKKLKQRRDELEDQFGAELEKRENNLNKLMRELEQKATKLKRKEEDVNLDEEYLKEERQNLEQRRQRLTNEKVEKLKEELNTERKIKKEFQDLLNEKSNQIAQLESQFHQIGHQSPEETLRELKELRREKQRLNTEISQSLSSKEAIRLKQLEKDIQDIGEARNQAFQDKLKAESELRKVLIGSTELADLRDQVSKLSSRLELKQSQLDDLQSTIDDYTKKSEGKETFHFCTVMDEKPQLQQKGQDFGSFENLDKLTDYLRHRIAQVEDVPLSYSKRIIRTFLAGLAIGKLTLLEGISGTGKTSLPRAFAKAIGGGYEPFEIIEVQSGWRDRQDLLGFFNTFENKYHESPFLKALYRAGTPQMKDTPFFIILDEMNLSHPEHYFADLLSQLENTEKDRKIRLDAGGQNLPKQFTHDSQGFYLQLPPNVWFIGTANQDETT